MTAEEIKNSYPKSWEKLKKYGKELLSNIVSIQAKATITPEEIADNHLEPFLNGVLSGNGRSLVDLFDINSVYISIGFDEDYSYFYYSVYLNHDKMESGNGYSNRADAEKIAFEEAFKILEKNL